MSQVKGIAFCRETAKSSWGIPFMHLQVTVADPGQAPTLPPPPLIFRPNWGPKGWKKIFLSPSLPPSPWRSGSGTKLYIIQCTPFPSFGGILFTIITFYTSFWAMPNSFGRVPLIYKLYIYKVYLLLTDAKLLMRDAIYKLYINIVYLLRRDTELILRDSIYNLTINTSLWGMPISF